MEVERVLDTPDTRALAVEVDPARRCARVEVPPVGRHGPYVVAVEPAHSGGWYIVDPSDLEATWCATFPGAVEEAVALAAPVFAERVARELAEPAPAGSACCPADVC